MSGQLLSRLQSVLNAAARLVFSARKSDHISPLLHELHWLRVPGRIRSRLCLLVYRCLHGTSPTRHISPTASVEPPTSTVVAVYALPSRTRWSWHRRTVQHSVTVLSQWLYQERGTELLPSLVRAASSLSTFHHELN